MSNSAEEFGKFISHSIIIGILYSLPVLKNTLSNNDEIKISLVSVVIEISNMFVKSPSEFITLTLEFSTLLK